MSTATPHPTPKRKSRLDRVKTGDYKKMAETGFKFVGFDELIENPQNERKKFRDMDGLIETVKRDGVLEPLTVEPVEGGKYIIILGHRRFRAAKAANLDEVPVIIGDEQTATVRRRKSIVSNVQRENVGPVEMAEGLRTLLDEDDTIENQAQLARLIGKRKAWISDTLRILDLAPALQRKVRISELSINYDSISRIARLEDQAAQARLIDAVLGGATHAEIREQIDEIKGKHKPMPSPDGKKPRQKYTTAGNAAVIIQSLDTSKLTFGRQETALKEALKQLRSRR